jgi:uncharacterized C2H2 Zn-finger protein
MNGQEIVKCPNCASNKVRKGINIYKLTAIISGMTIIGLIFIPFIYIAYRASVKSKKGNRNFRCMSCFHLFNVPNTTYYEYKKQIS